ncbi:MAG: helix-turn-helix transcriptional regulator [Kiritimatiellae bacterium]|nr:helix-turn-helix transcriptional regulator [Kiritimatiellia bacterium]
MNVGESIRRIRREHDLTQEQLGRIAGVTAMAVSQWENGRAVPRMGAIQLMADYFGIPKSAIMGDAREYAVAEMQERQYSALTADERELLELYRSMDASGREMALNAVRGMASSREDTGHVAEGKLA